MSLLNEPRKPAPGQRRTARSRASAGAVYGRGVRRSAALARLFMSEQSDPDGYYSYLAQDTVQQIEDYTSLDGSLVLDIGGGPGHFTTAFAERGARCAVIEQDWAELLGRGSAPADAVVADGRQLPVRDGSADICFSSNVLEHVSEPARLIDEMIRAARPGGLIYLSFTNWYSPWGGHEMSPWHYLGPAYAERRYVRRRGRLPKNRVGTGLYPVHIGPILRLLRSRQEVEIVDALPRYYPRWCRPVLLIPVVREVVTWNLLTIMRRVA